MSQILMCDCCEQIYTVDEITVLEEELKSVIYDEYFIAIDDVCDYCLDEIEDQMNYVFTDNCSGYCVDTGWLDED